MSVKKINGYKIFMTQFLGSGTYGKVYKGQQDGTKIECAIKIVDRQTIGADPYLKSALLSEIQIMSKLKSPNIVGFFDVLESKHNYYIVQEICDSDLQKFIQTQPGHKFEENKAIQFLTEICNGFLTLVKEGIVHRDIKPENILLSKGVLKIGDFGFAKENVHKKVKNESCVGSPLYMPIQLLKGISYTSKCDIWAIGCIFYQLLHGDTPWTAKTEYQLVSNIQKKILVIDPRLGDKTKDFLIKTLKIYEEDRICWDDLFKHPIFNGFFNKYLDENMVYENKYKKVMADLRFKVNSQNIDLKNLWENLGFKEDADLDFDNFSKFLHVIDPEMSEAETSYFFQKMDVNGDGSISLKELSDELEKYLISLTSKHRHQIPFKVKKMNSLESIEDFDQKSEQKNEEQFGKRVRGCFIKLNQIITNKGLTLYKTFNAYDLDKTGVLSVEQFAKIIKNLDSSFSLDAIQAIFTLIDEDGSKTIEFDELNNYFCKVNGIPVNMHLPKEYRDRKEKKKVSAKNRENTVMTNKAKKKTSS